MAGINLPIISKFDDKGVKQATSAFDGIGSSLGKIAGIVATVFSVRAISNFTKESITAAEGVAVANARIDQIAKSMNLFGSETQAVADRLKAYAEANELNLATDAEVIKATQAKLLTFKQLGLTADETGGAFDRATAAAIDLAAAGFGSAETNAVQLGKALQDPIKGITALTRSGITFTQEERNKIKALTESGQILEAQNMILGAIEAQVGGTAAATANASDKMKLAFDNVKETVGAALMPAFAALSETMIPLAEEIAPILASSVEGLTPVFTELTAQLPDLLTELLPIIPALVQLIALFTELAISLLPILLQVFETIVPIIQFFVDLMGGVSDVIKENIDVFSSLVIGIGAGVLALKTFQAIQIAVTAAQAALTTASKIFSVVTGQATLAQAGLNTAMLANPIGLVVAALAALVAGLVYFFTQTELGQKIWADFTKFLGETVNNFVRLWNDSVANIRETLNKLGEYFGNAFKTIRDTIIKAVTDFGSLLFKAGQDLVQGLINGVLNFGAKIAKALGDVVNGAVDGVKDLLGIRSPSKVFTGIGENIGDGLIKGMDSKLSGVAASAKSLAKAAVPAGFEWVQGPNGPYLEFKSFTSGQSDRGVGDFGAASASYLLRQQGLNQAEIDKVLTRTIGGTLDQVNATMSSGITLIDRATNRMIQGNLTDADIAERVAQGFKVVEKIAAPIEDLENAISQLVSGIQGGQTAYLKPMAAGGFVTTPTPALVGEAGPEVVLPLDRFERAIGLGNNQGGSYNININAGMGSDPVSIGREVVNAIKRYESVSGKVFVSA